MSTSRERDIVATFKLLLIGDSGTGKSSLLLRFTDDMWLQPDEVSATIGKHLVTRCGFQSQTNDYRFKQV
jgi:GTPase SAR1 family protein